MAIEPGATPSATAESADELMARVGRRLAGAGIVANAAGVIDTFIAVGFMLTAVVGESESNRLGLINGPIVALMVIAMPFVVPRVDRGLLEPTRRWLASGAPPGGGDLAVALAIPRRCVMRSASMWAVGMVFLVCLNLAISSPAAALAIGFTSVIAASRPRPCSTFGPSGWCGR